ISLRKLKKATNKFSNDRQIGEGRSAHVFRGILRNGQVVAVKRLKPGADRDADYDGEVGVLSRLSHPNIIRLIGFCAHKDTERIIVYEFMPLRTLYDLLHAGEQALDWDMRMRIGAGVAKGLSYLHNGANPRVIYRDLKPSNVLLDQYYHPKISDFGIAISVPADAQSSTVTVTELMGTHPYWAPEHALADRLSSKSDVYSFGVLLLEIIAGTVPLDARRPRYVADWVTLLISLKTITVFSFLFFFLNPASCIIIVLYGLR
ncbi:serine/threonine-protein kinase pbs1, partial [Phtheirospermum japonicum]